MLLLLLLLLLERSCFGAAVGLVLVAHTAMLVLVECLELPPVVLALLALQWA